MAMNPANEVTITRHSGLAGPLADLRFHPTPSSVTRACTARARPAGLRCVCTLGVPREAKVRCFSKCRRARLCFLKLLLCQERIPLV